MKMDFNLVGQWLRSLSQRHLRTSLALMAFLGLFIFGFIIFNFNIMGGGDVKLLAACGLFTGTQALPAFLIYTSLLGGLLALLLLTGRPALAYLALKWQRDKPLPRLLEKGAPVPYGLAIAASLVWLIWTKQLPGMSF